MIRQVSRKEHFSVDCHKTKTIRITTAIRRKVNITRNLCDVKVNTFNWPKGKENAIGFSFPPDWLVHR